MVKAIGSQFYGMTQAEISAATQTKTGGTLSKILKNLLESGVIREYPISAEDADNIENKVNAFSASPMHKTTHSIQVIIATTKGVANGTHRDAINQVITLEDLFK